MMDIGETLTWVIIFLVFLTGAAIGAAAYAAWWEE